MLKKLATLLLSLLLCLSLLPGQASAADTAEAVPPIQTEASETGQPDNPNEPVMPLSDEFPGEWEQIFQKIEYSGISIPRYSFISRRMTSRFAASPYAL